MLARCKRQEGSDGELGGTRGGGAGRWTETQDVTFFLYMREPERMGTAAWFCVSAEFSQCSTFTSRLDENGTENPTRPIKRFQCHVFPQIRRSCLQ